MRILALDWGEVRMGAAVSDPDGKIAFPLDKYINAKNALEEIKIIVNDLKVEKILIGQPLTLSGQEGQSAKKVDAFADVLKTEVACQIQMIDERFTTVEAGHKLARAGINEKDQRVIKDNIAAQLMLQQYLDTNNK